MQTSREVIGENNSAGPERGATKTDWTGALSPYEEFVDINPDNLTSLTRIEDRLILLFRDGKQLTIESFFLFEERYQRCLKGMSPDGDIWPALMGGTKAEEEIKYNFSQPATAWVFGGSAALMGAALLWLW